MKKVLSTLVAALVALSFAGLVSAAEPAPAMPAGHPAINKEEKAPVKKAKKTKKSKKAKKAVTKEEAKPAETPAAK